MLTRALARPLACVAVCLVLASGCGGEPSDRAEEPTTDAASSPSTPTSSPASESPAPSQTPTPTPTPSPSPTEPSASASASATGTAPAPNPGAPLRDRLLTARELPGFNAEFRWSEASTGPAGPSTSFGTCQRFGITSIGAERAVVRRFVAAVGGRAARHDRAGELVASFADAKTARRAYAVLTAWRAQCADRLKRYRTSDIGGLQNVSVPRGTAGWYLLTYGPVPGDPDAQFLDAQGMTLVGSRIAMVSMVLAGQDYNYEPGREPMVAALRRAAQKLG
jgi:hypothetical protein